MAASRRLLTALGVALAAAWLLPAGAAQAPQIPEADWPQFGRDAARTGYSPAQVDPPYCYVWKWYEAPIAGRTQPVVAGGRLYVGSMDGVMYAREAATGAPLWQYAVGGPIRHSAAVTAGTVVFSSHDGFTYALRAADGALVWKAATGPSVTAPVADEARSRVYVASTNGTLTALAASSGAVAWSVNAGAPILTSPALSSDGSLVLFGDEDVEAVAVDAAAGTLRWRRPLEGQSLADRSPVAFGSSVMFRSQPLYFFHELLAEGDATMDLAGAVAADWSADWSAVRPRILTYLSQQPSKQTAFVLDAASGMSRGTLPVLYTYGNNDTPAMPVVRGTAVYVPYRARHGIQTDGGAVHVTSDYDAELGRLDTGTLDIVGLRQQNWPTYRNEFRMTSDEPAALTMGGNILFVDNWERLGGIDVSTGALVHVGAVSNDWPECYAQCGPGTANPFFPMSGSGAAYPFPSPRVTEGHQRAGVTIAGGMIYWKVIEAGLAGIGHRSGSSCPAPRVWIGALPGPARPTGLRVATAVQASRTLADYVSLDLTTPAEAPPQALVDRLRAEVRDLTSAGDHLMPFYLQRGFSAPVVWPAVTTNPPGPPAITYANHGNAYWHDPGELLYSMALAYPYLDVQLQGQVRAYVAAEIKRYPVLENLPWTGLPWLRQGVARERYAVPFRQSLSSWPPPGASLSALYGLWLWSKNTGDWTYAASMWSRAKSLWSAQKSTIDYYADIAGAIGYARLAARLGDPAAEADGRTIAVQAMEAGRAFDTFRQRAERQYLDPREQATGWSVPVFYGIAPEVGLYLREHVGEQAIPYLYSREQGEGLRWWYLTRAGAHAEVGESSYVAPPAAWSHFLAHALVVGRSQSALLSWLDRPWCKGDLYSIQKIVATIQAPR